MDNKSVNQSYLDAGVNLEAGYESVQRIKSHIDRTKRMGVLSNIGGFGGLFQPNLSAYEEPVLVSGTDGVGTKLKLAFLLDKHDTIGQDCVAMCVNDIVCAGAEPLFFLDYIACGKNHPEKIEQIVRGIADGLEQAHCALIGGETAEMPGFYPEDEYDLAGFAVGVVDKKNIITGNTIEAGDVLIALPSSGVHSNGFSLVRKIFDLDNEDRARVLDKLTENVKGTPIPLGEALLTPTKIYVEPVKRLSAALAIKGISHITGGGFYENIPRILPEHKNLRAKIQQDAIRTLPLFEHIQEAGNISDQDMYSTFNMGVGMVICVAKEDLTLALGLLQEEGAYQLGSIESEVQEEEGILWI